MASLPLFIYYLCLIHINCVSSPARDCKFSWVRDKSHSQIGWIEAHPLDLGAVEAAGKGPPFLALLEETCSACLAGRTLNEYEQQPSNLKWEGYICLLEYTDLYIVYF